MRMQAKRSKAGINNLRGRRRCGDDDGCGGEAGCAMVVVIAISPSVVAVAVLAGVAVSCSAVAEAVAISPSGVIALVLVVVSVSLVIALVLRVVSVSPSAIVALVLRVVAISFSVGVIVIGSVPIGGCGRGVSRYGIFGDGSSGGEDRFEPSSDTSLRDDSLRVGTFEDGCLSWVFEACCRASAKA